MQNVNGILLILMAMAAFTVEDMFVKQLTVTISVGQVLILLGIGSSVIFATLTRIGGYRLFQPAAWQPIFLCRALAEAVAAAAFATALSLVDISVVAAVFQATPLVLTLGAALFLGESVGWRRMSAVGIGFIGVLMIIQPGLEGFEPNAMFVLIAVLAVSARDLLTRRMTLSVPSSVVAFQGFFVLIPTGIILIWATGTAPVAMGGQHNLMTLGAVGFGALGYYGIVQGMRIGDASAVAPFRYARLVFSLLVGIFVFQESPDLLTLTGAGLIIATGLYTFLRERHLAKRQPA